MNDITVQDVVRFEELQRKAEPRQTYPGPDKSGTQIERGSSRKVFVADTGTADTDFSVPHSLGYEAAYYDLMSSTVGGSLYNGSVAPSKTVLTLKFTGANAAVWIEVF